MLQIKEIAVSTKAFTLPILNVNALAENGGSPQLLLPARVKLQPCISISYWLSLSLPLFQFLNFKRTRKCPYVSVFLQIQLCQVLF